MHILVSFIGVVGTGGQTWLVGAPGAPVVGGSRSQLQVTSFQQHRGWPRAYLRQAAREGLTDDITYSRKGQQRKVQGTDLPAGPEGAGVKMLCLGSGWRPAG